MKKQWMLGFVFCLLSTLCSYPVFAASVEEASALYAKRGLDEQGVENAKKAAEMYHALSSEALSVEEKAYFLIKESEAHYFVGLVHRKKKTGNRLVLLEAGDKGYKAGLTAVNLLANGQGDQDDPLNPKNLGNEKLLALAMYWESANLVYWSLEKDIFNFRSHARHLIVRRISDILRLDSETMNYGVYQLPVEVSRNTYGSPVLGKSALYYVTEAFEANRSTLGGYRLSDNMINVTQYLEELRESHSTDEFCWVFGDLIDFMKDADDQRIGEMFPNLVPEAKLEYEDFMRNSRNTNFYEKKCI